jgi:hypothetical protein
LLALDVQLIYIEYHNKNSTAKLKQPQSPGIGFWGFSFSRHVRQRANPPIFFPKLLPPPHPCNGCLKSILGDFFSSEIVGK